MNDPRNDIEKIAFKIRLLGKCKELIEQRIDATVTAINNAQLAANSEEKSSAGDKYETSRAMNHLEKDMFSRQLAANNNELNLLNSINCLNLYDSVTAGCFIQCERCSFFIAGGLGKIYFEGREIYLLSPHAPVARLFYTKKMGSMINFKEGKMVIQALF